jgi:hypothetical protein
MNCFFKISFLLLLFLTCPKFSLANGDTIPGDTTTKYELWDPKNPDCPCHQYQKLADEEYKKLQEQQANNGTTNSSDTTVTAKVNNVATNSNSTSHSYHSKSKMKQVSKILRRSKLFRVRKTSGKKWKKGHLIDCGRF